MIGVNAGLQKQWYMSWLTDQNRRTYGKIYAGELRLHLMSYQVCWEEEGKKGREEGIRVLGAILDSAETAEDSSAAQASRWGNNT
jgi:hypothetical protein